MPDAPPPPVPAGLRAYLGCAGFALFAALILPAVGETGFARFFGSVPAWAAILALAGIGLWALDGLQRRGAVPRCGPWPVLAVLAGGFAFALLPIGIDLVRPFARDINVALPAALAFYPAMAFVAETVFHVGPLALLDRVFPGGIRRPAILLAVASIEPVFQVAFIAGGPLQAALTAAHLLAFNLVQLALFLRFGFAAMIGFRLAFYLGWHILWGWARLGLLA